MEGGTIPAYEIRQKMSVAYDLGIYFGHPAPAPGLLVP